MASAFPQKFATSFSSPSSPPRARRVLGWACGFPKASWRSTVDDCGFGALQALERRSASFCLHPQPQSLTKDKRNPTVGKTGQGWAPQSSFYGTALGCGASMSEHVHLLENETEVVYAIRQKTRSVASAPAPSTM